jgi:hypothetical protein
MTDRAGIRNVSIKSDYTIDIAGDVIDEYKKADNTSLEVLPVRFTFLGPPNLRLQQTTAQEPDAAYRTFLGKQKV